MNFYSHLPFYHAMRRLLLILMIALLPLRGWAGDAMATGMAAGEVAQMRVATVNIASQAHAASVTAHFDHETPVSDSVRTVADCAGHGADDTDASHCDTCSACQVCHTVALANSTPALAAIFQGCALPHSAADQFASADAALRQKPPIS